MFQPINSNILVELMMGEEVTLGGLVIPDSSREVKNEGIILAVGTGIMDKNGVYQQLPVEVGDRVVFNKTSGMDIEEDGKKCRIIAVRDILGKVL